MQVFLPLPDFKQSLQCLDVARLQKQRVEAYQILNVLRGANKGWINHPVVKMWKDYDDALAIYYNTSLKVWRGANTMTEAKLHYRNQRMPPWFGREDIHASHRSRLLFKGKLDLLADRIHLHPACKGRAHNKWLKEAGLPNLASFRQEEYDEVNRFLDSQDIPPIDENDNFYLQYGWTEPDNLEYVWS